MEEPLSDFILEGKIQCSESPWASPELALTLKQALPRSRDPGEVLGA